MVRKQHVRTVLTRQAYRVIIQGFIHALTRFHYRRLEKQKIKLNKDKAKARRFSENGSETKCYKSRATPQTAVSDSDKLKKLKKLKAEVDQMMLKLNKDSEEYSHVSGKCVNTTKGGENQNKELNNCMKAQRDTKKRKEPRNKPTNLAPHQTNKEEKYIKNL